MENLLKSKASNKPCIENLEPYNLTINDCLACSGCITEDVNINNHFKEMLNTSKPVSFILSPQSKINIYNHLRNDKFNCNDFEKSLSAFIKSSFNTKMIIDSSYARKYIFDLVYKESQDKNIIITDCPGTVMYIEKQAPHLLKYLSRIKTPQQVLYDILKGSVVVSVVPCFDKKLENGRDGLNIDYVITTYDFFHLLIDREFQIVKTDYVLDDHERTQMNLGFSNGGILEYILLRKYSKNGVKSFCRDKVNIDLNILKDILKIFISRSVKNKMEEGSRNVHNRNINSSQNMGNIENDKGVKRINSKRDRRISKNLYTSISYIDISNLKDDYVYKYFMKVQGVFIYNFYKMNRQMDSAKRFSIKGGKLFIKGNLGYEDLDCQEESYVRINGLENLMNFIKDTKINGLKFKVAEIYICSLGCINGPGQIFTEDIITDIDIYKDNGNIYDIDPVLIKDNNRLRLFNNRTIKKIDFKVDW